MTQRQRRRHRRSRKRSKPAVALMVIFLLITAAIVGAGSWVISVASEAPNPDTLKPVKKGENSIVFAGDGSRLGYIRSDQAREAVSIKRIPTDLQYATVAIEDQRFFDHNGVDLEGVVRAGVKNIDAGKIVEGGSTITMQLMRNLYISDPKRNLERKIEEAKMALDYEKDHSKRLILQQYLNDASYGTLEGRTAVGVQAAARTYFSEPVWKLTLEQSALLAGLPQAPSEYNPFLNPNGARERRNEVLQKMAKLGYISRRRAVEGYQQPLELNRSEQYNRIREPYFFDYVENKLIEKYGVNTVRKGGLRIFTTLDPGLQQAGRDAIEGQLPYSTDPAAAVVSIDPHNGAILAMASSGSYNQNQYNLAAQGHRQPGSSFKTYVLTDAINRGVNPYSTYYTSRHLELDLPQYGHWSVSTAENSYAGTISIAEATVLSDNTVFAQLDLDLGPKSVAEMAHKMGITSPLDGIPAEGIGGLRIGVSPLEMADAYATLASGGVHHPPVAIRKVVFPDGRVDHPEKPEGNRVISPAVAYEVTKILHENIVGGTGAAAYTGCGGQAGKTGTTDDFTDGWFVGYQPNQTTAVWVGYPDAAISMYSVHGITVFGGTFPAQIWHDYYVNAGIPCEEFSQPSDSVQWAPFSGTYTASSSTSGRSTYGTSGTSSSPGTSDTGASGYDPSLYAPGAGQKPAPAPKPAPNPSPPPPKPSPPPPPTPAPTPAPPPPTGGVGGGG
jgi:penicillin-binding protein 1A